MSARPRSAVRALLLGLVLAASIDAHPASRVRSLTLHEMVEAAGPIFAGQVVQVEPVVLHGLPATAVTFDVEDAVRGAEAGSRITLRFLGGPRATGGMPYRIAGMPTWRVGDRTILLAHSPSDLGLTAPVGLWQGRFDLSQGPAGTIRATPHVPGARLLEGVPEAVVRAAGLAGPAAGSLPYGVFMRLLRELARTPPAAEPR